MTDPNATDILKALDINDLTKEEQEELILDLGSLVFRGALLRIAERMDENTRADFDTLLEKEPADEEITAFLTERFPAADAVVEEVLADLRSDILATTG